MHRPKRFNVSGGLRPFDKLRAGGLSQLVPQFPELVEGWGFDGLGQLEASTGSAN